MGNSHADQPSHYSTIPATGHRASWLRADTSHTSEIHLLYENDGWTANGIVGFENVHFVIRMSPMWVVQQFLLFRDMDDPDLWLATDGRGRWGEMNGEHRTELDGCIDIDLPGTPFTNSLLIHRAPLQVGHSSTHNVITVDTQTLGVTVVPQIYTRLDTHRWRYISLLQNSAVEVDVDEFGFVIDEPGGFTRAD